MPTHPHIRRYREELAELIQFGGSDNEQSIRAAFQNCLAAYCRDHRERLMLVPELAVGSGLTESGIRPDGTVKDALRMARGYWEAKDTHDDLDAEIQAKFNRGYPRDNIVFEDSETAVLFQNGGEAMRVDMTRPGDLHRLISQFLDHELPEIGEFRQARQQFKADLPAVLENLRETVAEAEAGNPEYRVGADAFLELCRRSISPDVSDADVREMLLQHILTKDIFASVFREDQFHRENNVARQLDALERTFFTGDVRREAIDRLRAYYGAIGRAAHDIADYAEKQQFLKAIYEDFYQAYNPAAADRLGVVYTPNEVVDFIIRGTDHLLQKHFGKTLADDNVNILDPATGHGHLHHQPDQPPARRPAGAQVSQRDLRQRGGDPALLHRQPEHRVRLQGAHGALPGVSEPVLRGHAGQHGLAGRGGQRRRGPTPGRLQPGRRVGRELDTGAGAERKAHQRHHRQPALQRDAKLLERFQPEPSVSNYRPTDSGDLHASQHMPKTCTSNTICTSGSSVGRRTAWPTTG